MPVSTQNTATTQGLPPQSGNQTGFYLWVGVDPAQTPAGQAPIKSSQIIEIAEALGELAREFLPTAQTHTTLSLSALDSDPVGYVAPVQNRRPKLAAVPNPTLPNFDDALPG